MNPHHNKLPINSMLGDWKNYGTIPNFEANPDNWVSMDVIALVAVVL